MRGSRLLSEIRNFCRKEMERRGENKTQQNVLREDENEEKKKEL
jgi:hypothetical protein